MDVRVWLGLMVLLITVCVAEGKGKFTCFRKLKKNGKCAGIIRKGIVETEEECCRKGAGYAAKKMKVGKNRFRCTPCGSSEEFLAPVKRVKEKKASKAKKERRQKKERKAKPTEEVHTVKPVVEIKTRESWYEPARKTEISYSYIKPDEEKVRWGPWSPCSVTCGAGWRSRFKVCDDCDRNDYENVQSQPCMDKFYCPVDGNWGPWFPWQPCSLSCGGGYRVRQRKCNYPPPAYGGLECQGPGETNQTCNEQSCPVDGKWGSWTEFSLCSVTCGQGVRRKSRICNAPAPVNGGKNCHGSSTFTKKCSNARCPQDGGWSLWASWSSCAVTCGEGTRSRTRTCDSPRPLYGGKDCEGVTTESRACSGARHCPVHGGWSEWTNFGFCHAERCQKGYQDRSRSCTDPRPVHGGRQCNGDRYERVECFNDHGCPRNGSWCEWSDWSKCTATCKTETALRARQRNCACPAPKNRGAPCDGEQVVVMKCDDLPPCAWIAKVPTLRSDVVALRSDEVIKEGGEDEEEDEGSEEQSGDGADNWDQESWKTEDYPDHTEMEGN